MNRFFRNWLYTTLLFIWQRKASDEIVGGLWQEAHEDNLVPHARLVLMFTSDLMWLLRYTQASSRECSPSFMLLWSSMGVIAKFNCSQIFLHSLFAYLFVGFMCCVLLFFSFPALTCTWWILFFFHHCDLKRSWLLAAHGVTWPQWLFAVLNDMCLADDQCLWLEAARGRNDHSWHCCTQLELAFLGMQHTTEHAHTWWALVACHTLLKHQPGCSP